MSDRITYTSRPDNCRAVVEFIGPVPECPTCGGYGEYETEYGSRGCNECNSRLIPYIDQAGRRQYVDWGDTLIRTENGLQVIKGTDD